MRTCSKRSGRASSRRWIGAVFMKFGRVPTTETMRRRAGKPRSVAWSMRRISMLLERAETERDGRVRRAVRALSGAGHEVVLLHTGPDDRQDALRRDGAVPRSVRWPGAGRLRGPARRIALWIGFAWRAARERP